jgi:hypothetical protein
MQDIVPFEFLRASLSVPARVHHPRAPPYTLVLTHADFFPPRLPGGVRPQRSLAPALELSAAGLEAKNRFRRERLIPALAPMLRHEDWGPWAAELPNKAPEKGQVGGNIPCVTNRREGDQMFKKYVAGIYCV